ELPEAARLVPVRVQRTGTSPSPAERSATQSARGTGEIEVELGSGRRVCVRGAVDAGMLRTVLEELGRS
ncbi:MAG: hypothetical protein ACREFT_08840, partial [Acetobacteraceae bacterium]